MDELLAGLRAGDPRALRSAYEWHKPDVLAVAVAVLTRAAANRARDRHRVRPTHDVADEVASAAPDILDAIERDEEVQALWRVLADLRKLLKPHSSPSGRGGVRVRMNTRRF